MKELFRTIKKYALAGEGIYLLAVTESEGSAPRSSGAYMLAGRDGYIYGTIGGGRMEYEAQEEVRRRLAGGSSGGFERIYDLSPAGGMACGGRCRVQFCWLAPGEESVRLADAALEAMAGDGPWWLLLTCGSGEAAIKKAVPPAAEHRGLAELGGVRYYAEEFGCDGRVWIFGAGHVAAELVPLLCHLGFRCAVLDDRAEFASRERFPMADSVGQADFCRLENSCRPGPADYAVVMTRGHAHDALCERYLLSTSVGYIGIMGSKTKARLAREQLLAEGYAEGQLARITTPIGLDIGSETPAEIAVSIAAQLIQVRAERMRQKLQI